MQLVHIGLLYIVGSVLLALVGMFVVRALVSHEVMEGHKEVAGFFYGILGTIYAVILGFSVIVLWEQAHEAEIIAEREASQISNLHRLSQGIPGAEHQEFALALEKYCRLVIDEEWSLMNIGKTSAKAHDQLLEVWRQGHLLDPQSERDKIIYDKIVETMADFNDARRGRLLAARITLPRPLWFVLVAGAAITIGFSYLFGLKNALPHTVMTILLAASIGLGLFVIAALEGPFSGALRIPPDAFKAVLDNWHREPLPPTTPKP